MQLQFFQTREGTLQIHFDFNYASSSNQFKDKFQTHLKSGVVQQVPNDRPLASNHCQQALLKGTANYIYS